MKKLLYGTIALVALNAVSPALAADLAPIYKTRPSAVITQSGWYVWVDGSHQTIHLPTYALGLNTIGILTFPDLGHVQSFDPHLNGAGVRGALGYRVPGTAVRLEFGASYVKADGSSSQSGAAGPNVGAQFLNGAIINDAFSCRASDFGCSVAGTLNSSYNSWQANGKAAYDGKFGLFTLTPSAALFGGTSRAGQTLSQFFSRFHTFDTVIDAGTYFASTALNWTDFGGRAGLDARIPLNGWLSVGVGGWIGVASRTTSLTGNDVAISTPLTSVFTGASTVSASATTTAFLANAEAGFAIKPVPWVTLRGFVGLNYDEKVPGISGPLFAGSQLLPSPAVTTPAGIFFARETSYYAGGGVIVRFGPGPVADNY